ncbi:MAG: DUF1653 domain-containing protein [Patescibacteria group bacterium UBA2103]
MADLEYSEKAKTLELGRYRHYKGNEYDVLFVGRSSEKDELEEVVVYQDVANKDLVWVQSIDRFLELHEGSPRFEKL